MSIKQLEGQQSMHSFLTPSVDKHKENTSESNSKKKLLLFSEDSEDLSGKEMEDTNTLVEEVDEPLPRKTIEYVQYSNKFLFRFLISLQL